MRRSCRARLRISVALLIALAALGCNTFHGANLYREGTAALERGDVASAVVALEHAAALVPRASEIQNHLGIAYREAGRPDHARRAFERAVVLDCDNEAARHNLRLLASDAAAP